MNGMIVSAQPNSCLLTGVLKLGRDNSKTLGFLPEGAYIKYAEQDQLLVATNNETDVLGYLLYATSEQKKYLYIVHLCVNISNRHNGIARLLFDELKKRTENNYYGIRVRCRRDYEANTLWPKLGFVAINEMQGRSKSGKKLTIWWFEFKSLPLFSFADQCKVQAKLKVAIDANIFIDLRKPLSPENEESQSLLADWLSENIELCVTKEIFNEIDRNKNEDERKQSRAFISTFTILQGDNKKYSATEEDLKTYFPKDLSESDESDIRQLSRAITSDVQFFVTRDQDLLDLHETILQKYGIEIIRPYELLINQDQLLREAEYQPTRLAGSCIEIQRIQTRESSSLVSKFPASKNESPSQYRESLKHYLSNPRRFEVEVVRTSKGPIALRASNNQDGNEISIPLFRIKTDSLSATLARNLVQQCITKSVSEGKVFTKITDKFLSDITLGALRELGFVCVEGVWIKANLSFIGTTTQLITYLEELISQAQDEKKLLAHFLKDIRKAANDKDIQSLLLIEKMLWPAKITNIDIPAFIISIQPFWAMHLFDVELSRQDLFGGEPSLLFNIENVYYRASQPRVISAPARGLWYITKGKYQGTMAIRASSYIDDVIIDKPKILFSRFRRLGVFTWKDILRISKEDISKDIMTFHFRSTEIFKNPIKREILQDIWKARELNFHIQAPIPIPLEQFFDLYKLGMGIMEAS
jgi:predicted nucleic acid-binding protein